MKPKSSEKSKEQKEPAPKKDELQQLRQQIEDLTKEKNEIFERLQRVAADYENLQKRTPKQIADTITYEKEKIIKTLLPALDNFEHTLQNENSSQILAGALFKGIRIIYDQMLDILKAHGVEQINALGQKFDPTLHEAIMQKTDAGQEDNIVLEEFQKGYKLNGRVIRPSKVIVNKLQPEQDQQKEMPDQDELVDDETTDTE
jgi:molecular chaperone GrpE